ncbi:MAG: protease inhibitor I42 family protein [Alphaproteobacteria bacterium]|nr:protease inhibitor I42 family protein [Alphaproteobacteria bacterium]
MKKIISILLLIILTACERDIVYLSEQDSNRDIMLSVGQSAVITLEENPTTGYRWEFKIEPENQVIFSNIKEKYVYQQTKLIGAGGIKEFSFKIRNAGKADIFGYYRRPWEKEDKKNEQSVHYTIIAK